MEYIELTACIKRADGRTVMPPKWAAPRYERYKASRSKDLSRGGYAALLSCLEYCRIDPSECSLSGEGKPYLTCGREKFEFNNSHSGSLSLSVLGKDTAVGADIEYIDRSAEGAEKRQKIAKRFFSSDEVHLISESHDDPIEFFRSWTRHEALGKLLGTGFFMGDTISFANEHDISFVYSAADPSGLICNENSRDAAYMITVCAFRPFILKFI